MYRKLHESARRQWIRGRLETKGSLRIWATSLLKFRVLAAAVAVLFYIQL